MKKCYIFGALAITPPTIDLGSEDIIIAADGGLKTLTKADIRPDYIIGDFDSLGQIPTGDNVIRHPVMKNETDTVLAIEFAWEKGYRNFIIYGCIGGRTDHTYANVQVSAYVADKGGSAVFIGDDINVTSIKNSRIDFPMDAKGIVSVFPQWGTAYGVCEEGLLYELQNETLSPATPSLGVSNEFIGKNASVSVNDGILCIMWSNTND